MIYILIGIIIILFFIIVYQKNSYKKQQSKILQKDLEKLQQNYNKEKEKLQSDYDEEKKKKEIQYEEFLASIKEKEKLCNQLVEKEQALIDEKVLAYSNQKYNEVDVEVRQYFSTQQENIKNEVVQLENNYNTHKENLSRDLQSLREELSDLKARREAYIEALKVEEKRQQDRAFYTINLTEENKEDIKILRSIEDKLHNSDALNRLIYDVFIKKPLTDLLLRIIGENTYSGIYKITNLDTERAYIGRSTDVKKRLTEHVKGAFNIATIADQEIHRVMGHEGIDKFSFEILEKVEKDKLNEREKYWIDFYQTQSYGYNQNKGG